MNAALVLFVCLPLQAPAAAKGLAPASVIPAPALQAGLERELALLSAEKTALQEIAARTAASRGEKVQSLQKEIAALEVKRLEGEARVAQLALQLQAFAEAAPSGPIDDAAALATARLAASRLGLVAPPTLTALIDAVPRAAHALARTGQVRRIESGFFDEQGSFVSGVVLDIGGVALGVSDHAAGPLVGGDGARQLASGAGADAAQARTFSSSLQGSLPVYLGSPEAAAGSAPGFWQRMEGLPSVRFVVLLLGLLGIVLGLGVIGWLISLWRRTRLLLRRLPEMILRRELVPASALCAAERGPAGRVFACLLCAAMEFDVVEEDAGARLLREGERFARATSIVILIVLLAGAGSLWLAVGSAAYLWPALQLGAVVVLPGTVLAFVCHTLQRSLRVELEAGILQLTDVVRRAQEDAASIVPFDSRSARGVA